MDSLDLSLFNIREDNNRMAARELAEGPEADGGPHLRYHRAGPITFKKDIADNPYKWRCGDRLISLGNCHADFLSAMADREDFRLAVMLEKTYTVR